MPAPYLLRRNNIYYYRRRVPTDCRAAFKTRELVVSLRTTRRHQALRLLVDYNMWYDAQFDRIRRGEVVDLEKLLSSRISQFEEIEEHNPDGTKRIVRRIDPRVIDSLKNSGVAPETIAGLVQGFHAPASSPALPHAPVTPVSLPTLPKPPVAQAAAPLTLSQLQERFNEWRKTQHHDEPDWKWDPGDDIKFRRLTEILGADKPIHTITRDDASFVQTHILQLPAQTVATRGMPIQKVIELSKKSRYRKISSKQVNNHITLYLSLFEYAIRESYYPANNPFKKLRIKESKKRKNNALRDQFARDDLEKIFSHITFSDYKKELKRTGKMKPYRFWTPLIGLFTGARPCEISSLYVKDIKQVHGVWVFDFNENDPGKCSKTANAIRKTPIHSQLIRLGFIEYVESVKALGHDRIFPELNYEEGNGYGRYLNENFVRTILKPLKLHQPNKCVFYSFRHTLTTALDRCGVKRRPREQMMGREATEKNVGDEFYVKDQELPRLRKLLERVNFSKELAGVKPWAP
ncbi:MAG: site-specific integrase [Thiogranum sp.]|nr:site-specific integrase [Thiogranum sp.]